MLEVFYDLVEVIRLGFGMLLIEEVEVGKGTLGKAFGFIEFAGQLAANRQDGILVLR